MRKILIVGAGQAGLQLALCLRAEGYDVTIMSARTADEIQGGWPTSTQAMFAPALEHERDYGLNLWDDVEHPHLVGIGATIAPVPGVKALSFYGPWDRPGASIDQRLKMSTWLRLFESRGGHVVYHPVMTSDLAGLVQLYDLVVVAAGKGEIVDLFDRDPVRSVYEYPGRVLSAIYLDGVEWSRDYPEPRVRINIEPGVAETFTMPGLTMSGPCEILLIEAVPNGPFDIFRDRPGPTEHLRRARLLLNEHFPWEGELYYRARPAGPRATLAGAFTTTVRRPAAEITPGKYVLGMGDVVVVMDPISGQGANCASHSAHVYLKAILERGGKPFDREWMEETFETYYHEYAQHSLALTMTLLEPMSQHVQQMISAAGRYPQIAKRFGNLFPYPADIHDWLLDPAKGAAYVASVAGGWGGRPR
ncbi:MAG: FAD-binding oxidoreductase [Nocardiopsaceae bacterium]|nr:FAD-binding oxidoreductase [Nocardiopsaceae bacterium]